ncbi:MAG TPA: LOG family protein [Candidatus Woesebacteria bacterium]|nr:LOG family protein [Candidatus Woesebacteria bacterium]HOG37721.1 LOG family protein [Candidatus Woesebacteria bacterium]
MLVKTKRTIKRVAVFGDSEAKKTDRHFIDAYNVAKLLGQKGYIVLNGGGPGVMLAATLGAKVGGGKVETVVIEAKKRLSNYEGSSEDNCNMADKIVYTKNYLERMGKLVELADAYIILKGGVGTLSEIGLAWQMAKFDYGRHKPLVFLGKEINQAMSDVVERLEFDKMEIDLYEQVSTPEEAVEVIKNKKGVVKENSGWMGKLFDLFD